MNKAIFPSIYIQCAKILENLDTNEGLAGNEILIITTNSTYQMIKTKYYKLWLQHFNFTYLKFNGRSTCNEVNLVINNINTINPHYIFIFNYPYIKYYEIIAESMRDLIDSITYYVDRLSYAKFFEETTRRNPFL